MARPLMSPDMGFIGQMYAANLANRQAADQLAFAQNEAAQKNQLMQDQWAAQKAQMEKRTMNDIAVELAEQGKRDSFAMGPWTQPSPNQRATESFNQIMKGMMGR